MSSRSPSPPLERRSRGDADHRAEPRVDRLSLRSGRHRLHPYSPGRRAASMPAPPHPDQVSRDRHSTSPPRTSSVVSWCPYTPPRPEPEPESELELDSPPRITIFEPPPEEPGSPTSPSGSRPLPWDISPAESPERSTFGPDIEEYSSSDAEDDDSYFKSLVDNFITAAADVTNYTLSEDHMMAVHQRTTKQFAEIALKHYNNDEKNKIKYELTCAITSCGMMDEKGFSAHVNFTAKGKEENPEELFFAELRKDCETYVTTCVLSLETVKKVGGLRGSKYDKFDGKGLPIDSMHCYACGQRIKHPKDGRLYGTGHVAIGDYYHG
ncbi:hypothetical protein ACP70R_029557 [Stipagrostis hirtigluma subsp. patula]